MGKRWSRYQWASLALMLGGIILLRQFLPPLESLAVLRQQVEAAGRAAPLLYPALLAVCNLLLLPGSILNFGGGFVFGLWPGFLLALSGNITSAALAFAIGRALGRARMERYLRRRGKWTPFDRALRQHGWKMVVLSQLHPLFPVSLINYAYGVTGIGFWRCLLWSGLGRAPTIFLYVYLGTLGQYGVDILQGRNHPKAVEAVLWIGGLLLLVLFTTILARLGGSILAEAIATAEERPGAAPDREPAPQGAGASLLATPVAIRETE